MAVTKADFDVGIIGGGPAGSATAAYLAKAGIKCIVFESEIFPRAHVGESLIPSTTRVFKELGLLDQLEEAGFPKKYGAAWTSSAQSPVYSISLNGLDEDCTLSTGVLEGSQAPPQNYTYHVDRGKFDLMLLRHAQALGATVQEGVKVKNVDFSNPSLPLINVVSNHQVSGVTVRLVVDASGRRTVLGNQLGLKVKDPVFDQCALHSWFEDYDRGVLASSKDQEDFIFIHFLPVSNTWVWQIPVTETITSIGIVSQKKNLARPKQEREKFFWDCMGSRPEILDALRTAKQVRPLKDEGDYSYSMKQICGDNFVLLGDAARFIDPIFSTGVGVALNSARLASSDIIQSAEEGAFSKNSFTKFESTIRRGYQNWYDFISVYYRLNVLFTSFISDPKYRVDVLKLLQGDVYGEEPPEVLRIMKDIVKEVEANKAHLWHGYLGDLVAPSDLQPTF